MATPINPKFSNGDRVRIIGPGGLTGRIIELRGPLGGNRMEVYRIRLPGKLRSYTEVREDQLELLPGKNGAAISTEPAAG